MLSRWDDRDVFISFRIIFVVPEYAEIFNSLKGSLILIIHLFATRWS